MAKKKYHQSLKDRMHESKGMRRVLDEVKDREMYAGYDERRRMERQDYGMISEDHNAIANLPQEVMMRQYPRNGANLDPFLDDTQRGIDRQINDDSNQMKRHISKTKY